METNRIQERFQLLCRFCLSEDECLVIFTGEYELNERLTKVLDILLTKVDEDDGFPNKICMKCVNCIEQFVDFEITCVKSYELLEKARNSIQDDEVIDIEAENYKLEPAVAQDSNENDYATCIESDSFADEETNVERLDEEHISIIDEQSLHQEDITEDIGEDDVDEPDERTSYNLSVEQQQMLDAAMETQPSGFVERGSRKVPLVECIYCKNVYRGRNTLKKHLRIHLNIKDYRCAHCSRTFTDKSSLRVHEARHAGKSFECTQCNKTFFSLNELRQHLTMQHLERKYACDTCQRKFPSKSILNDHYRVHQSDRPFVCKHCGAGFKRNRNLNRHQLVHQKSVTRSKPVKRHCLLNCPVCSVLFDHPGTLLNHLKEKHAVEFESMRIASYQCPKCDRESNDLEECLNHQLVHYT